METEPHEFVRPIFVHLNLLFEQKQAKNIYIYIYMKGRVHQKFKKAEGSRGEKSGWSSS